MKEWYIKYDVVGVAYARVNAETEYDALQKALDHDVVDYDELDSDFVNPKVLYSID